MKRRAHSVFLSTALILMSTWSGARASELNNDAAATGRLHGGVSINDTKPAEEVAPRPVEGSGGPDGNDGGIEEKANGYPIMGPDLFNNDGTKSESLSWQTMQDGTLKVQRIGQGRQFELHNQNAWHYMQVGSNMERHSVIARNKGEESGHSDWHERAQVQFAKAKVELEEHLKLIQSGRVQVSPFYTLANLSLCAAALGQTQQSLEYYSQYLNSRERFWTVPHGNFKLAMVLLTEAKGDEELNAAKQLLLRTVGSDPTYSWNKVNADPEYRIISWRLISEIESRQGNRKGSEAARKQAESLLQPIAHQRTQNENKTCKAFVENKLEEIHSFGYP